MASLICTNTDQINTHNPPRPRCLGGLLQAARASGRFIAFEESSTVWHRVRTSPASKPAALGSVSQSPKAVAVASCETGPNRVYENILAASKTAQSKPLRALPEDLASCSAGANDGKQTLLGGGQLCPLPALRQTTDMAFQSVSSAETEAARPRSQRQVLGSAEQDLHRFRADNCFPCQLTSMRRTKRDEEQALLPHAQHPQHQVLGVSRKVHRLRVDSSVPSALLACEDDDEISRQDLRFCLTLGVKSSSQQKFLLLSKTPTSFPTHTWLQRQHGSIRIREPGCYCH
eukprot:CAMPEP_0181338504 /NCGR_PEP_ID=MMETSP1101-20121128/28675_1 /TAXON_ID=46948 /ORGANISM="Rhodomonas abbreviata, Strain Caron Lab Isolate" /LENGTH=287 /DNA_ID=CAMNT_0023449245 /DNA_START=99 /DNA_END=964 /DNA_ORIENTATION=-